MFTMSTTNSMIIIKMLGTTIGIKLTLLFAILVHMQILGMIRALGLITCLLCIVRTKACHFGFHLCKCQSMKDIGWHCGTNHWIETQLEQN
jgi:hypothetical protein